LLSLEQIFILIGLLE